MCCKTLNCALFCVLASVVLCGASRRAKIDQETFKSQDTSGVKTVDPIHFIYPRTGRLFHADYVRDNEIFRSLERTNFMRRGPFVNTISMKRPKREEEDQKSHVYVGNKRIRVAESKKGVAKEKNNPANAILFKVSSEEIKTLAVKNRSKRDTIPEEIYRTNAEETMLDMPQTSENLGKKQDVMVNQTSGPEIVNSHENGLNKVENKVEGDSVSSVKNNDTDKTLFVHDSAKPEVQRLADPVGIPEVDAESNGLMKETVVNDGLRLYPVYRGVKYYYPLTERRLVYSPQLTVHMDVPVVSEVGIEEDGNSTADLQYEGRSRRPLKKLAFPLLLALKLKTAIMVPLILGLIGLISFKGLWSGLTALGIAAALGLKALVAGGGPKVLVHALPPPPPPAHVHHLPPFEYAEYWSRRNDDHSYSDYRPSSWS